MKLHFIYLDPYSIYPPHFSVGVGYIAALLKEKGYHTSFSYVRNDHDAAELLACVKRIRPRVVAFSSMSSMYPLVKKLTPLIKRVDNGIFTLCGGIHPTLEPACLEETDGLDAICRGEGEYAMVDLLDAFENGRECQHIQNINFKTRDGIIKNQLRPLISDLDELPDPDREIFGFERICDPKNSLPRCGIENKRLGEFLFSRGCPFECSFCSNHALRALYRGKYVRFRGVNKALDEIHDVIGRYHLEVILIHDDIITLNKKWFFDFFTRYADSIRLPFVCNSRVGTCDDEMMRLLKEAGCHLLVFGVESGNDYIRNEVLKKGTTGEQIREAFALAHKYNIRTYSQNMVGIPGETPRRFIDTINLNAELEPNTPGIGIFHPYPGTELGKMCREKGLIINDDISFAERTDTVLRLPGFSANHIRYYHDNFVKLVKRRARGNAKRRLCQERLIPPYPALAKLMSYFEMKSTTPRNSFLDKASQVVRGIVGEKVYINLAQALRRILGS